MFKRLYDWSMKAGSSTRALWVFALVSFSESAMLPLPVDAVSIPIMLAARHRVWMVALIGTMTSVAGGLVGYGIGYSLYETLGRWLIEIYGMQPAYARFQGQYAEIGWFIVIVGAVTPIPYKLISIASGTLELSFAVFFVMSVLGRGLRFFAISAVLWWCGPSVRRIIDRNATLAGWLMLALLAGGFAALYFL